MNTIKIDESIQDNVKSLIESCQFGSAFALAAKFHPEVYNFKYCRISIVYGVAVFETHSKKPDDFLDMMEDVG
jgi:hypothetical protein